MPTALSPDQFAAKAPIHPDSLADYRLWEGLLRKWNARINLVAPTALEDFWGRHALDSAQILPHIPVDAQTIVDFGSGAGFPGIAVAIEAKHAHPQRQVYLIESAGKKASFLRSVSRETSVPAIIHSDRIEAIEPLNADVITARAFAPLNRLLPLAWRHLKKDGRLVLLKGQSISDEIAEAHTDWQFDADMHRSLTDETGSIAIIQGLRPT